MIPQFIALTITPRGHPSSWWPLNQFMVRRNNCKEIEREREREREREKERICKANNGKTSREYPPSNWITTKLLLIDWNGNPNIERTTKYERLDIQKI